MDHANDRPVDEPKHGIFADVAGVLEDHVNLAALESQYELELLAKRLVAFSAAFILALAAFLLAQVAVIYGLVAIGLPAWGACLLLVALYGVVAALIVTRWGTRNAKAGAPFSGTRRELVKTLQWIQKLSS